MDPNHVDQIKQTFQEKTANLPLLTPDQEKQILHEIIQERIAAQPQQSSQSAATDDAAKDEQASAPVAQPALDQKQPGVSSTPMNDAVKSLVDMAVKEDLYKATKMAYDTKNPFLIDQYHDTLVNEFYQLIKLQEQES